MPVDIDRIAEPLLVYPSGPPPESALQLVLLPCTVEHARLLNAKWHSRLPKTQKGPWQFAFRAVHDGVTYAVALCHNPSARCLPAHWIELRRLAIAPDAPRFTASRFLSLMAKHFKRYCPDREKLISYQDTEVHKGTIYRAAGWTIGHVQKARTRDRSKTRPSGRAYRSNQNGLSVDSSEKVRWECPLSKQKGTVTLRGERCVR